MSIKSKIAKIARGIEKSNGGFVHIEVIHLWKENWRKLEEEAKMAYLAQYGNLKGLRIVRTWVPLPAYPPTDEELALIHGTSDNGGTQ